MSEQIRPGYDLVQDVEVEEEENVLLALLEANRLKANDEFEEPDYTMSQNGTGFAPRGNIMALMAEMKHGKTFVNTTFAATILRKKDYMGLHCEIENGRVMFFDTEQDKSDGQRIQRRVQYLCGWDFKDDSHEEFRIYHLRELPFEERRKLIDFAIRHYTPDVAIVDGIRDLLQDFNSLEESADLIQWLMTLSSECNCAIWTVLHVNPNSDKMRGHLGTELGNKTTDVLRVTKNKDKNTGLVTFDVEHIAARHRDIDGWTFKINDDEPYGIPELLTAEEVQERDDNELQFLDDLFKKYMYGKPVFSYTPLVEEIKRGEEIRKATVCEWVRQALEFGIIHRTDRGKFHYIGLENKDKEVQQDMPF